MADRLRAAVGFRGIAHVEQQGAFATGQLHDLRLIHLRGHRAAELPGLAVVVAVDDMGAAFDGGAAPSAVGALERIVARNYQAAPVRAMLNLYSDSRPCRIPAPGRVFRRGGDVRRRSPCLAVVQEPDGPGLLVQHRAGVAASVRAVVPDHLLGAPGLAAIG